MTGPHHYREAERLSARAQSWADFDRWPMSAEERTAQAAVDAALAQAHATLALAASSAMNTLSTDANVVGAQGWVGVI